MDGKAVFSAIERDKHTEEDYEKLAHEYNDLVREHCRLKRCMLDILQENIRIVDELNKLTGGKEQ
jgi:hypothetical protein